MSQPRIIKDAKLTSLSLNSDLSVPFYSSSLPSSASRPGSLAYLASNSSLNYWTGSQWLALSAGAPVVPYTLNAAGTLGGVAMVEPATQPGPAFVVKDLFAGSGVSLASVIGSNQVSLSADIQMNTVGAGTSLLDPSTQSGATFDVKSLTTTGARLVITDNGTSIDISGNYELDSAVVAGDVSLVPSASQTGPIFLIRDLVQGPNVTLSLDANDNVVIEAASVAGFTLNAGAPSSLTVKPLVDPSGQTGTGTVLSLEQGTGIALSAGITPNTVNIAGTYSIEPDLTTPTATPLVDGQQFGPAFLVKSLTTPAVPNNCLIFADNGDSVDISGNYSLNATVGATQSIISAGGSGPAYVLKGIAASPNGTVSVTSDADNVVISGGYVFASAGTGLSLLNAGGVGPNITLKSIQAGPEIVITGLLSPQLTISSTALDSVGVQNWKAGSGSSVAGATQSVAVGDSTETGSGTGNVTVGYNASISLVSPNNYNVVVGHSGYVEGSNRCVVIGVDANVTPSSGACDGSIAIGNTAQVTNTSSPGSSPGAIAIGNTASALASNSIAIGNTASASAINAIAIGQGATNAVTNSAVVGNSASFILGTPGLLQSGAQWGVIAQAAAPLPVAAGGASLLDFGNVLYDPYSSAASTNTFVLQKANQMYYVTVTVVIEWLAGSPNYFINLSRYDSILAVAQPITVNYTLNSVSGPAGQTYTYTLSGITVSSNSTTDYVYVDIANALASVDAIVRTETKINIHRIN